MSTKRSADDAGIVDPPVRNKGSAGGGGGAGGSAGAAGGSQTWAAMRQKKQQQQQASQSAAKASPGAAATGTSTGTSTGASTEKKSLPGKAPSGRIRHESAPGHYWFELSHKRRVTVNKFRGALRVDIREFYDKDGVPTPGRRGISLNVEQFMKLKKMMNDIEATVNEML